MLLANKYESIFFEPHLIKRNAKNKIKTNIFVFRDAHLSGRFMFYFDQSESKRKTAMQFEVYGPSRQHNQLVIKHHRNGNVRRLEYHNKNGEFHSLDGPAIKDFYENGHFRYEEYWVDGKLSRKNGPAVTQNFENGHVEHEFWEDGTRIHANLA